MSIHHGARPTHLFPHLGHRLLVGLWHGPLMVTQERNHTIGVIVSSQLLLYSSFLGSTFVELPLESMRGVEGTEHFRGQALHQARQILVELCGLERRRQ